MTNLIADDDLTEVETRAYSGNGRAIYYLIGGLVERGRIQDAHRHADSLAAKGYLNAQYVLGEVLYLYPECPSAVADLTEDQRFDRYLALATPYATSDQPGAECASFEIADKLDNRERYEAAFPWFMRAAERGHEEAAIALGYAFAQGLGTAVDVLEGARWFMRSLEMIPVGSPESDHTEWPVDREHGWVDWTLFGEMIESLSYENRIELMRIVGKQVTQTEETR